MLNDEPVDWDLKPVGDRLFHILYKGKSYQAEVISLSTEDRKIVVRIENDLYTFNVRTKNDYLLDVLGIKKGGSKGAQQVKAPMPGLIIDILVKKGDKIGKNAPLVVLEAMKMENIIKTESEGTVKLVKVRKGQKVDKNDVLIEL